MEKSLILKLTEDEHSQLKALAAMHRQTIKAFVLGRTLTPNEETLKAIVNLEKTRHSLQRYDSFNDILKETQ